MKKHSLFFITQCSAALIAGIFMMISASKYMKENTNYFSSSLFIILASIFAVISFAIGLYSIFTQNEKESPFGTLPYFPTATPIMLWVIGTVFFSINTNKNLPKVCGVFLIVGAVSYFLLALKVTRKSYTNAMVFMNYFTVIGIVLTIAYLYFDMSIEMNSPLKTIPIISIMIFVMQFIYLLGYLLKGTISKLFYIFNTIAIATLPIEIFVGFTIYFTGRDDNLIRFLLAFLSLFFFFDSVFFRFFLFFKGKEKTIEVETVDVIDGKTNEENT